MKDHSLTHSQPSPKPLISIISPIYNNGPLLSRFVDSILAQTYTHWELIIVNDGSTDNSLEICERYAQQDERIRVFSQVNQGQSVARNLGLEQARGELITFVDGDDAIKPNTYKAALETLERHPHCDIVAFPIEISSESVAFTTLVPQEPILGAEDLLEDLLTVQQVRFYIWDKIYHAPLLKNLRFAPGVIMEDNLFICQALLRARGVCFSREVGYEYHQAEYAPGKNDWTEHKEYSQTYVNIKMVEALAEVYPDLPTQRIRANIRVCNQVFSCIRHRGLRCNTVQMGKPSLAKVYWSDIYRSRISLKYKLKLCAMKLWARFF